MAAQANQARAPRAPGDELAAYLNRSASSAVQNRFQAGVRAVQAADGTSAAVAAGALLLEALAPIEVATSNRRDILDTLVREGDISPLNLLNMRECACYS